MKMVLVTFTVLFFQCGLSSNQETSSQVEPDKAISKSEVSSSATDQVSGLYQGTIKYQSTLESKPCTVKVEATTSGITIDASQCNGEVFSAILDTENSNAGAMTYRDDNGQLLVRWYGGRLSYQLPLEGQDVENFTGQKRENAQQGNE